MKLHVTRLIAAAVASTLVLAGPPPAAAKRGKQEAPAAAESSTDKVDKSFAELTDGATLRSGFLDTYEKGDHLYLAVPPDRLERELLLVPRIGRGIGAGGLYSGLMYDRVEAAVVVLVRRGDRVFLEQRPHRFTAVPGSPEAIAAERSYGGSVLAAAKVEAERQDGTLLIDVYPWVVSDLLNAEARLRDALRWRLEPGEPVGDKMRPATPITFYLDPSIPEVYRPTVAAGIEGWKAAFEAAGWVDAIRAAPLPEGADPDDSRYPTIRWITSDDRGFGAVGNPIADPRTGEILDADVLVEAGMVEGFLGQDRALVRTRSGAEAVLSPGFRTGPGGLEVDGFGLFLGAQVSLARLALAAGGAGGAGDALAAQGPSGGGAPPADPLPEYVRQTLLWTILHEVGHDLGLNHNFRASSSTPVERLHDREWTGRHGLGGSVARFELTRLGDRIGARLKPPASFDDYTRAHLEESAARIGAVLEAQLTVGLPGS